MKKNVFDNLNIPIRYILICQVSGFLTNVKVRLHLGSYFCSCQITCQIRICLPLPMPYPKSQFLRNQISNRTPPEILAPFLTLNSFVRHSKMFQTQKFCELSGVVVVMGFVCQGIYLPRLFTKAFYLPWICYPPRLLSWKFQTAKQPRKTFM